MNSERIREEADKARAYLIRELGMRVYSPREPEDEGRQADIVTTSEHSSAAWRVAIRLAGRADYELALTPKCGWVVLPPGHTNWDNFGDAPAFPTLHQAAVHHTLTVTE